VIQGLGCKKQLCLILVKVINRNIKSLINQKLLRLEINNLGSDTSIRKHVYTSLGAIRYGYCVPLTNKTENFQTVDY